MVRTDKLRGLMAEKKISGIAMANELGVSPQAFYKKMSKGRFGLEDARIMTKVLGIENPVEIFFAENVT